MRIFIVQLLLSERDSLLCILPGGWHYSRDFFLMEYYWTSTGDQILDLSCLELILKSYIIRYLQFIRDFNQYGQNVCALN